MNLRPYQERAVSSVIERLKAHPSTIVVASTGSGKTIVLSAVARAYARHLGRPANVLVLQHRDELVAQNRDKFRRVNPEWATSTYDASVKTWAPLKAPGAATFAMVPTLCRPKAMEAMPAFDLVISDECFPAGTSVGGLPIETLREGDMVPSFDESTGAFCLRRVVATMSSAPSQMVRVHMGGVAIACTSGHPFLTTRGWVPAAELLSDDRVVQYGPGILPCVRLGVSAAEGRAVCEHGMPEGAHRRAEGDAGDALPLVPEADHAGRQVSEGVVSQDGSVVLQPRVLEAVPHGVLAGEPPIPTARGAGETRAGLVGADEGSQPNGDGRGDREDADDARAVWASDSRWEWSGHDAPASVAGRGDGVGGGGNPPNESPAGDWLPDALQDRPGRPNHAAGGGDRRSEPPRAAAGAGPQERRLPGFVRVDCVEVLERGSDGTFGGVCRDGCVYNIEVEGTHTYLVGSCGVVVHNCHHACADSWRAVLDRVLEVNPQARLAGFTATPNRGDRRGLGKVFRSVADQIGIGELIQDGYLVPPVARVLDLDVNFDAMKKTAGDFDMEAVAECVDQEPITQAVIAQWRLYAGDRQTIVFCATVAHARHVAESFGRAGVRAGVVTGEDRSDERAATLSDLASGKLQVVVNVYALTEGFDDQRVSCVVLLRPSSYVSTVIQMIGRGLRTVDPALHPGVVKVDCEVLDFGASLKRLGGLDQILDLDKDVADRVAGVPLMKSCPECLAAIPTSARECVLCGYVLPLPPPPKAIDPSTIRLRTLDLILRESQFAWIDLPDRTGRAKIAAPGKVWALAFQDRRGIWHAFGGGADSTVKLRHLASGTINVAMSRADDFLGEHADPRQYGRGSYFMRMAPSDKQIALASKRGIHVERGASMYVVGCLITADLNRAAIRTWAADLMTEAA